MKMTQVVFFRCIKYSMHFAKSQILSFHTLIQNLFFLISTFLFTPPKSTTGHSTLDSPSFLVPQLNGHKSIIILTNMKFS